MIVEVFFRNFYRNYAKFDVDAVERREFAFQRFGGGMVRHNAFKTLEELRRFVTEKAPRHIYHSAAYYERPGEEDMERKGWLGADLIFDIDGDHLDTEACREGKLVSLRCLEDAKEECQQAHRRVGEGARAEAEARGVLGEPRLPRPRKRRGVRWPLKPRSGGSW